MYQKIKKRIIVLGMCFLLMVCMTEQALAMENDLAELSEQFNAESSSGNDYGMGVVAACGENEFIGYGLAVFVQNESQGYIFTTYDPIVENAEGYVAELPNGNVIAIEPTGEIADAGLVSWRPADGSVDNSFLNAVYPYNGQEVQVFYSDRDGNLHRHVTKVTGVQNEEQGFITLSSLDEIEELLVPASVLDMDGNCVAIITNKVVIACAYNKEYFYGSSSSGSSSSGSSSTGSSSSGTSTTGSSTTGSGSSSGGSRTSGSGSNDLMTDIMTGAAIGGVCGVIGLILKKKKGKSKKTQDVYMNVQKEEVNVQPKVEVEPFFEDEPVKYVEPQKHSSDAPIQLRAVGGYMDGRLYPITGSTITFGRDPSSTICFPADTKGVSRVHCKLFWKNGTLMLMDMGSSYGTYIKGMGRLNKEQPVAIKEGDVFYIGEKNNSFVIK